MIKNKFLKALMIIVIACIAITVFGGVVMYLWNGILPAVIGVKAITFLQAIGILVLSKILFGGGPGRRFGGFGGSQNWKTKMRGKFENMTPDEREKMKAAWKNRCAGRGNMEADTKDSN